MSNTVETTEAREVINGLMDVIEALMPGLRHIAVQDYAAINDKPLAARKWLIAHPDE